MDQGTSFQEIFPGGADQNKDACCKTDRVFAYFLTKIQRSFAITMSTPSGKVTTLMPKDKKEGESSADDSKKRAASPADDADDASSESSRRVSKRKRAKVKARKRFNFFSL